MENRNKTYRRAITSLLVLLACAISVLIMASTLAYFNIGAEQQEVVLISNIQKDVHTPKVIWKQDNLKHSKKITDYQRDELIDSYLMCWYKLNKYWQNGNKDALRDHFSDEFFEQIYLDTSGFDLQRIDLSHNLTIKHFSLDNQFVAFTDEAVRVKKKIVDKASGQTIFCEDYLQDFNVVMTLDEGRWRIRQLVSKNTKTINQKDKSDLKISKVNYFRGVNYYPAKYPWYLFWENYNEELILKDLKMIKSLKLELIRIFIPFELFGKGKIDPKQSAKLQNLLDQCLEQKIKVVPTLFDFPIGFEIEKYSLYDRHLETILRDFEDHRAIAYWCLKNEPDLDFKYQGEELTLEWLDFIIERARYHAPKSKFTIGWSHPKYANRFHERLDLISIHYYEKASDFALSIAQLRKQIGIKPIVLEEFGLPSKKAFGLLQNREDQKDHILTMVAICKQEKIPWIVWTLHDFEVAPSEVFGWKPWVKSKQKHFGIIDSDGKLKFKI